MTNKKMVQYSVWPNCNNNCKFCLRKDRSIYSLQQQIDSLHAIVDNIKTIDWKNEYPYGISLLGGEIYNITDIHLQKEFLALEDIIISNILKDSIEHCRFSSVTNGIYNPDFLYRVIDKLISTVGLKKLDLNFSFDLKYRYKNEHDKNIVLKNVNAIHQKYGYIVGLQMILTQYFIDMVKNGDFSIRQFLSKEVPGNMLSFLYPHPVATGNKLNDFNFRRCDLLWFVKFLRNESYETYLHFIYSTRNSGTFKYTGLLTKLNNRSIDINEKPRLADGKETLNPKCGHSVLYQCYSDSDRCLLCDLLSLDSTLG